MEKLIRVGRSFYGIAIGALGIQQLFYGDLRPVIAPSEWPAWIHASGFWAYITGTLLLCAGALIIAGIRTRIFSMFLGLFLLFLFIAFHVPYRLFISPYLPRHVGVWINALKELALSGGAFIIAGSALKENPSFADEKFIMIGRIFFSITMIVFGYAHFLYPDSVSTLVPSWIPGPFFWTYFAGVALIGSGVAIILKIKLKAIGILLGTMIFLWFIVLHIPRAIANPFIDKGNEVTSVFEALGFSGIAFVIAGGITGKKDNIG